LFSVFFKGLPVFINREHNKLDLIGKQNINRLVERCKKGNKSAQYHLYLLYSDSMFSVCKRYIDNQADAEEVLQDSFVKAFDNIKKLRENEKFGGWLKKITINQCLNFLQKRKMIFENYETVNESETDLNTSFKESVAFESETINKAVEALPDGCRTILNLYLMEDYKHKEIAKMLNISESTSKSQYRRALQLLKTKLTVK